MRWPSFLLALALTVGTVSVPAYVYGQAAAEHRRFLEALKSREYYDTAVEYLDMLASDPSCPPEIKETLDYEAGVALVSAAQSTRIPQAREQNLAAAVARLEKFVSEHPKHSLASAARAQLGQVLIEKAKAILADIEGKPAEEQKRLRTESRKYVQEAKSYFDAFEKESRDRAKQFQDKKIDSKDEALLRERDLAYADYLKARMFSMGALYQMAQTYGPDEKERTELLKQAAKEYENFYDTYKDYSAGFFARFYQGVCHQELGQDKEAIDIFKETLTVPGEAPELQRLRTEALARLIRIYRKQKNHSEVVATAISWEESARPELRNTEWGQDILYNAALSAIELAKAAEDQKDSRAAQQYKAIARRFLESVGRSAGPLQVQAQTKLGELVGTEAIEQGPITSFADGKSRGDAAWARFIAAIAKLQEGEADAEQTRAEATQARNQAIEAYRGAIAVYKNESAEELNLVRYYLIFLYWDAEMYEHAAVLGEFLARHYPQAAGAARAGEIAVKAYRSLFTQARQRNEDAGFELQQMRDITQYVLSQWPTQPEAGECVLTLLESLLDLDQFEEAQAFLSQMPEDSPSRARGELRVGQVLWMRYAKLLSSQTSEATNKQEADRFLQQARTYFESGLKRLRSSGQPQVDYFLEYSLLLLCQLYLNGGQTEQAIAILEDPAIGPLALIRQGHSAVQLPQYQEEVFKLALRAYVGAQQLDKAFEVRDQLEKLVAGSGDTAAAQRLAMVYVALGRQLEEQLRQLRNEGNTAEVGKLLQGFTSFLDAIQQKSEGMDFRTLNWVAETFLGLAKGLDPGGPEVPKEAVEYYTKALQTYVQLIKRCEAEPGFGPEDAPLYLRVRMAAVLRGLRLYDKALEAVLYVIDKQGKENRLDAQIEAAQIYQEWAEQPGKEQYYDYAIRGGYEKNGRYLIWGWGGIARRVGSDYKRFEEVFHQARYNIALCRMKLAQKASGAKRDSLLREAEADIRRTYLLYPSMGGKEWYAKYDQLLRTIQQLQGEKNPLGLKAFEQKNQPSTVSLSKQKATSSSD